MMKWYPTFANLAALRDLRPTGSREDVSKQIEAALSDRTVSCEEMTDQIDVYVRSRANNPDRKWRKVATFMPE